MRLVSQPTGNVVFVLTPTGPRKLVYTTVRFTYSVKNTIAMAPLVFGTGARSKLLSNVEQPIQKVALPDLAVDISPVLLEFLAPLSVILAVRFKGRDPR